MATSGTLFPGALDPPIGVTLSDDFVDPDHVNTADARARAVAAKVGADGSIIPSTIDYRIRHLIAASTMTIDGDYVTLWSAALLDGSAVTIDMNIVAVMSGANEALGYGTTQTWRCKAGSASLVGGALVRHDQRTLLALADVLVDTDGARTVRLRVKSGDAAHVHWTARGAAVVAQPGGM